MDFPRFLMTASAAGFSAYGLALLFAPAEVMALYDVATTPAGAIVAQHVGALLLGFGVLNGSLRRSVRGGIYGRPVAAANFAQLLAGSLVLIQGALGGIGNALFWAGVAGYLLLTLGFGWMLFGRR